VTPPWELYISPPLFVLILSAPPIPSFFFPFKTFVGCLPPTHGPLSLFYWHCCFFLLTQRVSSRPFGAGFSPPFSPRVFLPPFPLVGPPLGKHAFYLLPLVARLRKTRSRMFGTFFPLPTPREPSESWKSMEAVYCFPVLPFLCVFFLWGRCVWVGDSGYFSFWFFPLCLLTSFPPFCLFDLLPLTVSSGARSKGLKTPLLASRFFFFPSLWHPLSQIRGLPTGVVFARSGTCFSPPFASRFFLLLPVPFALPFRFRPFPKNRTFSPLCFRTPKILSFKDVSPFLCPCPFFFQLSPSIFF